MTTLELRPLNPPEGYTRAFAVLSSGHFLGDVLERRVVTVVKTRGQGGRERHAAAKWYARRPGGAVGLSGYPKAGHAAKRLLPPAARQALAPG